MKRTILILAALALTASLVIHFAPSPATLTVANPSPAGDSNQINPTAVTPVKPLAPPAVQTEAAPDTNAPANPPPGSLAEIAYRSAVDNLISPHSTYLDRQAALKELKDSGRLADAAAELEKLMADDPKNALYPAVLGETYLRLCSTTTDVRAQAIWAMTADADFETSLNLDPSNWDARFTKSVAMTFWPDNMNKGPEIIQNFNTLIQQQEQESPEPQFASSYEWLGKEYQKLGQASAAQQTWQRGAALFPNDSSLQNSLAAAASTGQQ